MEKSDTTLSQVIFQSIRTMVTVIMFGGMTALFINGGSGIFEQSIENLENARLLITSIAS